MTERVVVRVPATTEIQVRASRIHTWPIPVKVELVVVGVSVTDRAG